MLDLWLEKRAKKDLQGEAYLTRFVDDFVVAFQYKRDAEHFDRIALHGMETAITQVYPQARVITYADDGVVLHEDRLALEQC